MNTNDEMVDEGPQGNNSSSALNSNTSTIKIDSLCIKLGFVKEKVDAEKCRHFSIRGYVSGMREKGSSDLLPFVEELPPIDVPHFKYWLCQSCLRNCGNKNISSHETPLLSVCDQSIIRSCARSFPPKNCNGVAVLPFGEGTSGLKRADNTNDDDDNDDDDERVLPVLGVNESQRCQEKSADNEAPEEPITNVALEENSGLLCRKESNDEDPHQDSVVKETITDHVGPQMQSSQQNDHPNGHTKRKTRKVRLLKELLCGNGNNEIQKREKENSSIGLDPKPSSSLPPSSLIKRKVPHDQDQNKKSKIFKGNNVVAKTTIVEHVKDPGVVNEGGQNDNKYLWNKHGTHRSSNVGKVNSDPVTAWRSIFNDVAKPDNHVTTYDMSKERETGPRSNFPVPPHPEKKFNFSKKIPKNPLKSQHFEDNSRREHVGLDLSLNYEPHPQLFSIPSSINRPSIQDYSRKNDFFIGETSIPHRIPSDLKSKEGQIHDVSINRHAVTSRPMIFQDHRPYTYGSCSGHQKLDFSDPYKRNNGVIRGYSDVIRPHNNHNHQRQGNMVSDEREIVELMAKNQYERNLCEMRSNNNNNSNNFVPHTSSFHNINMTSSSSSPHQDYLHMNERNQGSRFFRQEQVSEFNIFDGFQRNRNQQFSGIWNSDSGVQRHYNSSHYHVPKPNKKVNSTHFYTPNNMQFLEGFKNYNNGRNQNETNIFTNFPTNMSHGYTNFSEKNNNQKSIMDLDLNVVAPNVIEEQNNINMTSSSALKEIEYYQKNIHSLDSSYPNEAIPAMQLLSLMDAGKSKSNHSVNTDERNFSKPSSHCNTHCNLAQKTKPIPNFQFPNSRYFQSSSLNVGTSFSCGFQTGQNVKLTSGQGYYKPQEEKSGGVFPVPLHVSEDRSEQRVKVGPAFDPVKTEICTINKNPADFSTPGPENVYMINVEDLVIRGEKGRSVTENGNGPKRQKRS